MGDTMHRTNVRPAFTLVELLVVIVIIGILMSLMTAAAMHVSRRAKTAAIKMDITQLVGGVEAYKANTAGKDYPPDVSFISDHGNATLRNLSQKAVLRHLRMVFPQYRLPAGSTAVDDDAWKKFSVDVRSAYTVSVTTGSHPGTYVLDPDHFDPTTALVFFLGGLPEGSSSEDSWRPAGFHADPQNPFQQGSPRKEPAFTFDADRIRVIGVPTATGGTIRDFGDSPSYTGYLRIVYLPPHLEASPYVYFRSRKDASGAYEYGGGSFTQYACTIKTGENICVPYLDGSKTSPTRPWRNLESYQIIAAGLDDTFGEGAATAERRSRTGEGFSSGDFDNIANFSEGTLEDENQ